MINTRPQCTIIGDEGEDLSSLLTQYYNNDNSIHTSTGNSISDRAV